MPACQTIRRLKPLFCFFFLGAFAAFGSTSDFVLISDIHFNPLADPSLVSQLSSSDAGQWESIFSGAAQPVVQKYGQDTAWPLFASFLKQVQTLQPRPKLIVVTGDILPHHFQEKFGSAEEYRAFEKKTFAFVGMELANASGGAPVVYTVGNNDQDCGDYKLQPDGPFLKDSEPTVQMLAQVDNAAMKSWDSLGSFARKNPLAGHQRIIVVNSNFWSSRYVNACGDKGSDPGTAELSWLGQQLADAQKHHDKVWLVYHIPPGMDGHSSAMTGKVVSFWKAQYSEGFGKLLDEYQSTVELNLAGHTHLDDFRLLKTAQATFVVLINPGLSPNINQNPAFRLFSVDGHGRVTGETTYFAADAANPTWQAEYSEHGLNLKDFEARYKKMADGDWQGYFSVSRPTSLSTAPGYLRSLYCATGNTDPAAFSACIAKGATRVDPSK